MRNWWRKWWLIGAGVVGAVILIVAALVIYAIVNLNAIIQANRAAILARASAALGRAVAVREIHGSFGWGIAIAAEGVTVADDPDFSATPFVQANDVYLNVDFLPLLRRRLKINQLVLHQPEVHLIRNRAGELNVSTLAHKGRQAAAPATSHPPAPGPTGALEASPLAAAPAGELPTAALDALDKLSIKGFALENGRVDYRDEGAGNIPIAIGNVNLNVADFSAASPFNVDLSLAMLGNATNLEVHGTAGPILDHGVLEVDAIPLAFSVIVGPATLAQVRSVSALAHALPPALGVEGPVTVTAKAGGTVGTTTLSASGDLSANRLVYASAFDKAAGVPFKFTAAATRANGAVSLQQLTLVLAGLEAKLTQVAVAGGVLSGRVDTNRFNVGGVAQTLTMARKFRPAGAAEIHTSLELARQHPRLNGTITLAGVSVSAPASQGPAVQDLNGEINFNGNAAKVGPLTFKLGASAARLQADVTSLQPLQATYALGADQIVVADLLPARTGKGHEKLTQVNATGTLSLANPSAGTTGLAAASGTTRLTAASGMVANVPFTNLALAAGYAARQVTVNSLSLRAFNGALDAAGSIAMDSPPAFNLKVDTQNLDLQQALAAQHAKAAGTIRGQLTANAQLAGRGRDLDQIKPGLRGNGRAGVVNGKLVGVNVVAEALNRVDNLPGIGALLPASVIARHPELFKSKDTDIDSANLTFQVTGPRLVTHDLTVRAADYTVLGDGWFDMDKNLDLQARILLSRAFSNELIANKGNLRYLTNNDGLIEIPLRLSGQLPKPTVAPDIGTLASRAASHAVKSKLGGFLQKNGIRNPLKGLLP